MRVQLQKGGLSGGSDKKGGSLPQHIPVLDIYVSAPPPPGIRPPFLGLCPYLRPPSVYQNTPPPVDPPPVEQLQFLSHSLFTKPVPNSPFFWLWPHLRTFLVVPEPKTLYLAHPTIYFLPCIPPITIPQLLPPPRPPSLHWGTGL